MFCLNWIEYGAVSYSLSCTFSCIEKRNDVSNDSFSRSSRRSNRSRIRERVVVDSSTMFQNRSFRTRTINSSQTEVRVNLIAASLTRLSANWTERILFSIDALQKSRLLRIAIENSQAYQNWLQSFTKSQGFFWKILLKLKKNKHHHGYNFKK